MAAAYPPATSPANDKTTLWGILGIVFGLFCCWPLGVLFGVLSLREARRFRNQPTLAYIAFVASALNILGWTGWWYWWFNG